MATLRDWFSTFKQILFSPTQATFALEAGKARGKLASAIVWLDILVVFGVLDDYFLNRRWPSIFTMLFVMLIFPIILLFFVFCLHFLYQRLFHRKKDCYAELLYLFVGIFVPFMIANGIAVLFHGSIAKIIAGGLLIYPFILLIVALKAVTRLTLWQSILTVLLGSLIAAVGYFCIPIFFLSLMNTIPRGF